MIDFGIRKQGVHIAISLDESNGDNYVLLTIIDNEGVEHTITGVISWDE